MSGEGSIYRRADGLWVAQLSQGPRGSRKLIRRYGRTKADARARLEELRVATGRIDRSTTVGAYLHGWLEGPGRTVLKASTWSTYELTMRRQLLPAIGDVPLAGLTPEHVESMAAALARSLTPKGIRNVLSVLSRILAVAERRGQIARNPVRFVEPPRLAFREERHALTAVEARRIREAVAGDRLEALYVVTLAAGLRQAEVLGLRWADVDLEAGTLRVAVVLGRVGGQYVLTEPKTRRSRRTVALPAFAAAALRDHRSRQLAERLAAGVSTQDGLVFVTEHGRPISAGWLSHRWPKIAARADLAGVTFHELRHGQASLLVAAGVHPRVVQERLGHATVAMSMDVYSHVGAASDRDAADRLQEAIG